MRRKGLNSEKEETDAGQKSAPRLFARMHIMLMAFFVFLFPIKFGNITGVPEIPLIWDNSVQWALDSWPVILFPLLSSLLALSTLIAFGKNSAVKTKNVFILSSLWLLLALVSALGFVNAGVFDFPLTQCLHIAGLAIFAFSLSLTLSSAPDSAVYFIRAIIFGAVFSMFIALHQILWGFADSIDFIQEKELETGLKVSSQLWMRIVQTRVFSPFTLCNSLAAHIILTLPLVCAGIIIDKKTMRSLIIISTSLLFFLFFDRIGEEFGRGGAFLSVFLASAIIAVTVFRFPDKYSKIISWLLSGALAVLMLFILKNTFSRAAVLAMGLTFAILPLFLPIGKKIKIIYFAAAILLSVTFFAIVNQNRNITVNSSMHARVDYWQSAVKIFLKHPFLGTGWGDFFHDYTKIKNFPGNEAPHSPHNFILAFASQCGIPGLLSILSVFITSFAMMFKRTREEQNPGNRLLFISILCGWTAWTLHSMADLNFQIPGTVAAVIAMSLICVNSSSSKTLKSHPIPFAKFAIMILAILTLAVSAKRMRAEIAYNRLYKLCEGPFDKEKEPGIEDVERELKRAVEEMPYSPYPWASAGIYAQSRGHWKASENFYSEAIKRSPERASFYYRKAIAQNRLGKIKEALENVRAASELFPNNEEYSNIIKENKKKYR
jgi:hypothetical protein